MSLLHAVLLLVAVQRLAELLWSRRNERRLRARGAVEHGQGHYPLFFLIHGGWLLAMLLLVPADAPVSWPLLLAYLILQPFRIWVIASLGDRWSTRILIPPGEPPLRAGPYRFLRHPNYLIVGVEIPLLPAAFGAWWLAVAFGLANLALLRWRIDIEERVLRPQ